jgi:hypothetical protein
MLIRNHSFPQSYSLPDVSAGRIARELWRTSQEFPPADIPVTRGMNNRLVGGRSSETQSHPIDMINQRHSLNFSFLVCLPAITCVYSSVLRNYCVQLSLLWTLRQSRLGIACRGQSGPPRQSLLGQFLWAPFLVPVSYAEEFFQVDSFRPAPPKLWPAAHIRPKVLYAARAVSLK